MRPQYIETDEYGTRTYHSDEDMTNIHREDGPAIEKADGSKYWIINNTLHREDGPAIEMFGGFKFWYINNKNVTEEEHAAHFSLPGKKTIKPNLGKKKPTMVKINKLIERQVN